MKSILIITLSLLLCPALFQLLFAEEAPETIKTIHLKDGRDIECNMGWIEGDTLYYTKYGGKIGIAVKTVDLDKTFEKSLDVEKKGGRSDLKPPPPALIYDPLETNKRSKISKSRTSTNKKKIPDDIYVGALYKARVYEGWPCTYHDTVCIKVSCSVKNLGEPGQIAVGVQCVGEEGYILREGSLRSNRTLWKGEDAVLSTTFSFSKKTASRIRSWRIVKASKSKSYRKTQ